MRRGVKRGVERGAGEVSGRGVGQESGAGEWGRGVGEVCGGEERGGGRVKGEELKVLLNKKYCYQVDVERRPGDAGSGLGRRLCVETWTGA
jgi:hypothetical protein